MGDFYGREITDVDDDASPVGLSNDGSLVNGENVLMGATTSVLLSSLATSIVVDRRSTTISLSVLATLLAEPSHEPASASWTPSALLPVVFVVVVAVAHVTVVSLIVIDDDVTVGVLTFSLALLPLSAPSSDQEWWYFTCR